MAQKLKFYERYGVEEYYVYDPDKVDLTGWLRSGDEFEVIENLSGWVSPRLGIRFELTPETLRIYRPDGEAFLNFQELAALRDQDRQQAEAAREQAKADQQQAEAAQQQAAVAQQ